MPKSRLSDIAIARVRAPATGQDEIRDAVVPGLVLRLTSKGRKTFCVRYRVLDRVNKQGRLTVGPDARITLGQTPPMELSEAREQAIKILKAAAEGRDLRTERREANIARHSDTFINVRRRFIDLEMKPNVKNWKTVESTLRLHVEPYWAAKPVADIRRRDVHELFDGYVAVGKVAIAVEVRKHLFRFFKWCVSREIIVANPMADLDRGDVRQNKDRAHQLTDAEIKAVWYAAGGLGYPFGPLHQLLILTGQRRNEWANAKWSEIDATARTLTVPKERHKSKRGHAVPLSDAAWAILETLPKWNEGEYLFSTTGGVKPVSGFSKTKERLDKASGLSVDFRPFHDYRAACETRLASLGFNQDVRDAVLGHAKPGLQRVYNLHEYMSEKRAALDAYAVHIMKVVG
jgi:integrase